MDQNPAASVTEEYRDHVYKSLFQAMLDGLSTGEVSVEQSKAISQFVLDHLDSVQTREDLAAFLTELSRTWSVFQSVSTQLQEENLTNEKIKAVQQDLQTMTTE